ncbi:hypothetical protein IKE96_04345, partial [bacterium]|nr:hypothetical protein [bacterium]
TILSVIATFSISLYSSFLSKISSTRSTPTLAPKATLIIGGNCDKGDKKLRDNNVKIIKAASDPL